MSRLSVKRSAFVNFFYFLQNSKVLADLAIWEPKTFEAIIDTCRQRAVVDGIKGVNENQIDNKFVQTISDKF